MLEATDTIIQGLLLGGLYALFAIGLSITYGVMRLVNIAHGDFLVLAAYLALWPVTNLEMHPFVAILPVVVLMFCLGYTLQRVVLNRTMGPNFLAPMLATFGMSIILRNGLQQIYHSDSRSFQIGALGTNSFISATPSPSANSRSSCSSSRWSSPSRPRCFSRTRGSASRCARHPTTRRLQA